MGLNGEVGIPEAKVPKSEPVPNVKEIKATQGNSNKNRSQSKRKRRSAKR
jgi:hypothetical protein